MPLNISMASIVSVNVNINIGSYKKGAENMIQIKNKNWNPKQTQINRNEL